MEEVIHENFRGFRGILAADESDGTSAKRLASVNKKSTPKKRHSYRHTIFSAPDLNKSVGGVILFDETLRNKETIAPLIENNIILGISISCIIGLLAGMLPAIFASRLDPVEAIRSN